MNSRILAVPLSFVLLIGALSVFGQNAAYSTTATSCTATLEGSQEVPPVDTDATGSASVDFDPATNELSWMIEFSGLSGAATAAHFHGPAASGANAGVQVNIGETSGLVSPMEGSAELTSEQASMLLDGELYINIHTAANPNGEIRGQVSCEEEPAPDGESPNTAIVVIGDQEYEIQYVITGGTLNEVTANPSVQTLVIEIASTADGNLTLWLPNDVIDSEDDFGVFVDDESAMVVSDELEPTADARVLRIAFESGTEQIEIVGTSMAGPEDPTPNTVAVEIQGQSYDLSYLVNGGTVDGVTADVASMSLTFAISSNASGTLTVWLPNDVIDAEEDFTVLVDGQAASVTELAPTADARVLEIDFEEGASEIEIIGTSIVPEFGVLAIAAAAGILSAIVASTRLRIFGKR